MFILCVSRYHHHRYRRLSVLALQNWLVDVGAKKTLQKLMENDCGLYSNFDHDDDVPTLLVGGSLSSMEVRWRKFVRIIAMNFDFRSKMLHFDIIFSITKYKNFVTNSVMNR